MTGYLPASNRLFPLDLARTLAIGAMALYHFVFDLELFGLVAPGTATTGGWRILAYATASSFLALAGLSLWLAHGTGIRWPAFWRRFGKIAGAAALITAATAVAMPQALIHFGILHAIALCSLFGLAALRVPAAVLIALAALAVWAPMVLRADVFNTPFLWWVGLSTAAPPAADYVPMLPWVAPFLLGVAGGKLLTLTGRMARPSRGVDTPMRRALAWPGRHSLILYLLHQPVLIGLIWVWLRLT